MPVFKDSYRGVSLLIGVHSDLLLFFATLAVALLTAGYLGTL